MRDTTGHADGRPDRTTTMPWSQICTALDVWRRMGGSTLTVLGGEPTEHPDFVHVLRYARVLGYEQVTTITNGLAPAARKLRALAPTEVSSIQISLDGGSHLTHDQIHGPGTFATAITTVTDLTERDFDVRFRCTVGRDRADREAALTPREWIAFYQQLPQTAAGHATRVRYQPTYASTHMVDTLAAGGYPGCLGRTLNQISIFPDGRCHLCSYLAGTDRHRPAPCHHDPGRHDHPQPRRQRVRPVHRRTRSAGLRQLYGPVGLRRGLPRRTDRHQPAVKDERGRQPAHAHVCFPVSGTAGAALGTVRLGRAAPSAGAATGRGNVSGPSPRPGDGPPMRGGCRNAHPVRGAASVASCTQASTRAGRRPGKRAPNSSVRSAFIFVVPW